MVEQLFSIHISVSYYQSTAQGHGNHERDAPALGHLLLAVSVCDADTDVCSYVEDAKIDGAFNQSQADALGNDLTFLLDLEVKNIVQKR